MRSTRLARVATVALATAALSTVSVGAHALTMNDVTEVDLTQLDGIAEQLEDKVRAQLPEPGVGSPEVVNLGGIIPGVTGVAGVIPFVGGAGVDSQFITIDDMSALDGLAGADGSIDVRDLVGVEGVDLSGVDLSILDKPGAFAKFIPLDVEGGVGGTITVEGTGDADGTLDVEVNLDDIVGATETDADLQDVIVEVDNDGVPEGADETVVVESEPAGEPDGADDVVDVDGDGDTDLDDFLDAIDDGTDTDVDAGNAHDEDSITSMLDGFLQKLLGFFAGGGNPFTDDTDDLELDLGDLTGDVVVDDGAVVDNDDAVVVDRSRAGEPQGSRGE